MSWTPRKPYLWLKMSLREFFSQHIKHIKELHGKFSEMEKPYLDGSYPEMHLDWPDWDWPPWGPLPPWPSVNPFVPVGLEHPCVISCLEGLDCCDEGYDDIICLVSHYSSPLVLFEVTGSVKNVTGGAGGARLNFCMDGEQDPSPTAFLHAVDSRGNECVYLIERTCVDCQPGVAIEYTDIGLQLNETTQLGIELDGAPVIEGDYGWELSAGSFGSLTETEGLTTIYQAPSSGENEDCVFNAFVRLLCKGEVVDTVQISVNTEENVYPAFRYVHQIDNFNEDMCENPDTGAVCVRDDYYDCFGQLETKGVDFCHCTSDLHGRCGVGVCQEAAYGSMGACISDCIVPHFGSWPKVIDVRTAENKEDGCCPAAVFGDPYDPQPGTW